MLTRGGAGATKAGQRDLRVPPGHPEGYLEGFATLYTEAARVISGEAGTVPGIEDGLEGMRFVAACIASSRNDGAWTPLQAE